jgi:hypothetical protein
LSLVKADTDLTRALLDAPPEGGFAVLILATRNGKVVLVREDTTLAAAGADGGEDVFNAAMDQFEDVLPDLHSNTGGVH